MVYHGAVATWVLLNTAKNTREQNYSKIQGFQQQGSSRNQAIRILDKIDSIWEKVVS